MFGSLQQIYTGFLLMKIGSKCKTSDVILEARPWPRGTSRPNFYGFGLEGSGLGLGLCLHLDTCTDNILA